MVVELFTDGACRGNPGPGGWGVLLRSDGKQKTLYGSEKLTTNNRMELLAVIEGMRALKSSQQVIVTTDSKYVQQGMGSWIHRWKQKGWRTAANKPVKNVDLWKQLDALVAQHEVTWKWVKAHAGHRENEMADALANLAIDEMQA